MTESLPTDTPRGFHVETTWKRSFQRSFPRRFNVESTWCVSSLHYFLATKEKTIENFNRNTRAQLLNILNIST